MQTAVNAWSRKGDDILRPWAINETQELQLREAEYALAETITLTSTSRLAGAPGSSILDHRPVELLELDERFAAEEAMWKMWGENTESLDPVAEEIVETDACETIEVEDPVVDECPIRKPVIEPPRINAVVYVKRKGPAIANLSTTQYKRLIKSVEEHVATGEPIPNATKSIHSILPKHFVGKSLKLGETNDLTSSLVISPQSTRNMESANSRLLTIPNPADDSNRSKTTNKSLFKSASTDTYLSPSKRSVEGIMDRYNKSPSVATHILHTARREDMLSSSLLSDTSIETNAVNSIASTTKATTTITPVKAATPATSSFFVTLLAEDEVIDPKKTPTKSSMLPPIKT